ncbi:hypothetical protein EDF87_11819 [Pseudomonas helmanticensis]|uniref:DAHL domain-containing protein n=1 Tax=Pseudomonas helmanticensis TaxID=1471381 RepID=A0A4R7UZ53_9PSED|nr:hypothetical protein EDF87_11819 [Pseudomonas helmanticensis]
MINISRRRSLLLLTLVALALASILLFLYLKSSSDQTMTYTESRDLIRQIKQQNSQWENEILKARVALTHNYDPLVSPMNEMNRLWARFDAIESGHGRKDSAQWNAAHESFLQAMQEKTRLVEQFKSHNALLRNSLAFLPTAEDDIQQQLASLSDFDKLQLQNITTDTYDLLLSALEFAQVTSDDRAADIEVGLNKLKVNAQRLPLAFQTPIKILSSHISLIAREQPRVNQLLESIEGIPVADSLDNITTMLDHDQQRADQVDRQYHFYLLLFSVLLMLSLVWLAIRLIGSSPRSIGSIMLCKRPTMHWNSGSKNAPGNCATPRANCSTRHVRPAWRRSPPMCCTTSATCSTA